MRNIAVIGAAGKMGKWLCKFLSKEGFNVFAYDINRDKLSELRSLNPNITVCDLSKCTTYAEAIIVAVPIDSFEQVIKELKPNLRDDHLIIDICSVKRLPVEIMHRELEKGIKLGTHPLFGPRTKSINGKKVVLTPINSDEIRISNQIIEWLNERGSYGILLDPAEHDSLMSTIMGVSHAVGLILSKYLSGLDLKMLELLSTPTYNFMSRYATAILAGNLDLYVSIQKYLPVANELRKLSKMIDDFLCDINQNPEKVLKELLDTYKKILDKGLDISKSYEFMYKLFEDT
ncbi:MAG: prephenate dehydrogenase/arogenate dehydrogenase family protein [Sulfolobales archaeon]